MAVNKENVKIHVSHLKKNFDKQEVLRDISTDIYEGVVDGNNISDPKIDINKARENIGMVFQHFNLFNNLNVMRNLTLAPEMVGEVLQVMKQLAAEGMTMVIMTHDILNPKEPRTINFINKVL